MIYSLGRLIAAGPLPIRGPRAVTEPRIISAIEGLPISYDAGQWIGVGALHLEAVVFSGGVALQNESGIFVPSHDLAGSKVYLVVTATDDSGVTVQATSAPVTVETVRIAPTILDEPRIVEAVEGRVVAVTFGSVTIGTIKSKRWYLGGGDIIGIDEPPVLPAGSAGSFLTFEVTWENDGLQAVGVSVPVEVAPPILLAAPGVVSFSAATGDESGEVVLTILAPLPDGGDGSTPGDGLGVASYVDVSINHGDTWAPLGTGALALGPVSWIGDPGVSYDFMLRARSAYRDGTPSGVVSATAYDPGDAGGVTPTDNGTWSDPLSLTAGDNLSIDFDDYVSDATSYEIVSGIAGASYNSTTHVYSMTAIPAGDYSLVFRAVNGANSITLSWNVSVAAAVLAPTLTTPISDQALITGGSLSLDLRSSFTGTDMVFSVSPSDNATFGLGTGSETNRFKNKVPLSAAFAATVFTVTATNAGGSASDTFTVTVADAPRAAAPVWGTTIRMKPSVSIFSGFRAAVVDFPTGIDVVPGSTVRRLWSSSTPDADGNIASSNFEALESIGGGEWQSRMDDPARRGNPAVETAAVALGSNPIATAAGSNIVTITQVAHGFTVPRTVRIGGATAVGGITVNSNYQIASILDANHYTVVAASNATATATGGGAAVTARASRANYAVWGDDEASRAERFRVALEVNGVVGYWSEPATVPALVTDPALTERWFQNSQRLKVAFDAVPPWGGSEGKQFQHCVCWNKGAARDPKKKYWLYTGQDENGISFSPDGGRTIGPVVGLGLWGSSITGIYYNSDDLDTGCLLVNGGHGFLTGKCGLYFSADEATTFRRIDLKLPNGDDVWKVQNTYFPRVDCNLIDRRPQNAAGTLTDAQRPIYFVAQVKFAVGSANVGDFSGCYLFRWKGGAITDPANWTMVYSWAPADIQGPSSTINSSQGMTWVKVAPNGDLVIGGRKGVWVSQNADGASVTFTKVSSASVRGIALDMTTTGVSGCVIGVSDQGTGAPVLKTSNIRTTGFSAPANTGIPANVEATSLNGADYNFNRLWLVFSGNGSGCRMSVNGGGSWTSVSCARPPMLPSSEQWRWNWGDRVPAVYPHPVDPNWAFAITQQSAAVSDNGGASFDGFKNAYFDHSHKKGWGFDKRNFKRLVSMQQDGGAFLSEDAPNYGEYLGVKYNVNATKTGGATGRIDALVAAASGVTSPVTRTSGKGAIVLHDSDMTVFFEAMDANHDKGVPIIVSPNGINDPYGNYRVRTEIGWSRCATTVHHPTIDEAIVCGKWFITDWLTVQSLPAGPFSASSGSSAVTVNAPSHGLTVGRKVMISGAASFAGLDANGLQTVTAVPNGNTFRFDASGSANANVGAGGGSSAKIKKPAALDSIKFTDRSNCEVLGYSMPGATPIWYFGGAGSTGRTILRSTDTMGAGPVVWATATNDFQNTAAIADPFRDECVYYVPGTQNGSDSVRTIIRRIRRASGVLTDAPLWDAQAAVLAIYSSLGLYSTGMPSAVIEQLVPDLAVSGRIYALLNAPGLPVVFQIDGASGDAAPTVKNITWNLPHTNLWRLDYHPVTGELVANSSMGEFWLAAPAEFTGPQKSYMTNALNAFYARDDVPEPVILPSVG